MSDTYRDRIRAELSDLTYRGVQMTLAETATYTRAVLRVRDDELDAARRERDAARAELEQQRVALADALRLTHSFTMTELVGEANKAAESMLDYAAELARVRSELADARREIDILNGPFERYLAARVEGLDGNHG